MIFMLAVVGYVTGRSVTILSSFVLVVRLQLSAQKLSQSLKIDCLALLGIANPWMCLIVMKLEYSTEALLTARWHGEESLLREANSLRSDSQFYLLVVILGISLS